MPSACEQSLTASPPVWVHEANPPDLSRQEAPKDEGYPLKRQVPPMKP